MAIEVAKKAKEEGIKQFIFMSSAIVYGDSSPIGVSKIITENTIPQPKNFYGDTKLKAEEGIRTLIDNNFKVCIIRSPMIYESDFFTHHIHVVPVTSREWINYINFRNYLNAKPFAAGQYEEVKINLLKKYKHNRKAYTDGKAEIIAKLLKEAFA